MWHQTWRGRAARPDSPANEQQIAIPSALRGSVLPTVIVAIAAVAAGDTASAATFRQASTQGARQLCDRSDGTQPTPDVCASIDAGGEGHGVGGFSAPSAALAVQERLRAAREALQKQGGGASSNEVVTLGQGLEALQKQGGGASSDEVVSLGQGLSVFGSAGAEALTHFNNRYEDGYQSTIPSMTVGADYQVTPWLVTGLAFNYFNFNGDYDDGGHFNTNSFGPIAYLSVLPFDGAFADITLGYARKDYFRNRHGQIGDVGGHQTGGNGGNEYSTALLLGYDYPIKNFTIGPRFGLNYIATQIDDYREHGNTGLELRYSGQDQSSLQSSLGALATMAISTQFGVLLPQVSASWVHDYDVGYRNINASYVADPTRTEFSFKREPVAPNFAKIGVGVSTLLPNRWQPFLNLTTIQGNRNLVSYGGTAGLRVGL